MEYNDMPREEILKLANKMVAEIPGATVYFKFTCKHCAERCTFVEANTLFETGDCEACGKITTVEKAGFMLVVSFADPPMRVSIHGAN